MAQDIVAGTCPPHFWEVTLVYLEGGLHDHYVCVRCATEKDVLRGQRNAWTKASGRRGRGAA